jgi:hypothetical protein
MNNEDLSHLNLPSAGSVAVTFFGKGGTTADEKAALAKSVDCSYDHENISTQYFIMFGRGEIIDPYQADFGYTQTKLSRMYKYKKVSLKCFNSYIKYLETKNRIHFTTARRLLMEN